jgi:iron uptake system EfeUOB component EfeO/EfeM
MSSSGRTSNESSQLLRSKSVSNIKPSSSYTRKTPEQLHTNIVKTSEKLYDYIKPIIEKNGKLVYQLKSNDATLKSLFDKYTQKINEINKVNKEIHETLIQTI